jgi:transcriptional regulator with XRE-family HTH domain
MRRVNRRQSLQRDCTSRFAEALKLCMEERGLSLLDVSDRTEMSYEHTRKLTRGLASPSPAMLKVLCAALDLDRQEMNKLVTIDKIHRQFGHIPEEISGKNPALGKIEFLWPKLTDEQRAGLEAQAAALVTMNADHHH